MDHETHIGFVYAHAEGHGGHHDVDFVLDEGFLGLLPPGLGQAGMIGGRGEAPSL